VSVYLDASVLIPLFTLDPFNEKADRALDVIDDVVAVSEFARTEFSSVIAARVRMRDLRPDDARSAYTNFDDWCAQHTEHVEITNADIEVATVFVRRLDISLRAPDALHLAVSRRIGAGLLTFDRAMASAARALGIRVLNG
jgi:uncharacterized protein